MKIEMKSLYKPLATLILVVGALCVWVVVEKLPKWMGTTSNQHQFIDVLEKEGAIDFSATTLDGREIQMAQFKGKWVILSFWASWCGPCVEEFPSMIALLKQFPEAVEMVAVSSDYTKEDIDIFFHSLKLEKNLRNLHVVWDPDHKISQIYQAQRLPESFVFGKDQKLMRKVVGSIQWDSPDAVEFFKGSRKEPAK